MASIEQVEAWQKEIEEKAGLPTGYTNGFSLVRFRIEQASRAPSVEQTLSGPIDEFCQGDVIIVNLRPLVDKIASFLYKLPLLSNIVVK